MISHGICDKCSLLKFLRKCLLPSRNDYTVYYGDHLSLHTVWYYTDANVNKYAENHAGFGTIVSDMF